MPINNGGGAGGIIIELDPTAVPLVGGEPNAMTGTLYVPAIRNILNENLVIDAYNDEATGTHYLFKFNPWSGGLELPANSAGIKFGDDTVQTTAFNFTGFDYEIHVSQVDGNDTTGDGSLLKPYASITQGLTAVASQRKTVIVHPGTYTENPSITVQYTVLTTIGLIGGNTVISGTVSTNKGCTISGLKMTNLTITAPTGTGNVNILNCEISATLSKSSNADYTLIRFCDIGATSITSSGGLVAIFGGNPNFITINNAGARVIVKNAVTVAPVLLAGNANFVDSILLATGATSNALTTSAGTIVTLANSQIIVPSFNNVARVSLSGFYSIFNTVYDKPNSTLVATSATGGSTNSIDYFQQINADGITFADGSTQSVALFANQIVTNSNPQNIESYPPSVVLAETDAKTIYSSSKNLRDFIHRSDGTSGLKNYTLNGFKTTLFESVGCVNVKTVALTNMTNLQNVKIASTGAGTIENIDLNGSQNVTNLVLSGLIFSTTNMSNMVSNFVMKTDSGNTLLLTDLNLAGAIPSTWYNGNTEVLGIDNVAVNNLSFINPTTLPNLKWLRISDNVTASLPSTYFASFTHLETLYARGRGANGINTFSLPASLKAVDLSNSNFYDFEASMSGSYPNLISINFSNCGLDSAYFIPVNSGVKYINLENNDFSSDYDYGRTSIITLLNAINALNESGFVSSNKEKELLFTGSLMPVFTTTPTSVTNLRSRGYVVELQT